MNSNAKVSKNYVHDVSSPISNSEDNFSNWAKFDNQNGQSCQADEIVEKIDECIERIDNINGDHETQVSEGGEADLHKYLSGCTKNPGHKKFVPVDKFTIFHLPEGYRDEDLYKYIKATADLTVRVDVKLTSPHRPEFWPNTKVSYPFYNMQVKTNLRYGSGMMSGVDKFTYGINNRDGTEHWNKYTICWCKQCQHSDTASHVWWEFYVHTATHVVFDDIEASHTSVRLFYDREESSVVSVDQLIVDNLNIESDGCLLKSVTCDKNLSDNLNMLWTRYVDVWMKVVYKYVESVSVHKLNFIVSHPHGCCKQVSLGHWVHKYEVGAGLQKFTYTTCTCPGSSGAKVHCVGYTGVWSTQLVHSGSLNTQLNCSGAGKLQ